VTGPETFLPDWRIATNRGANRKEFHGEFAACGLAPPRPHATMCIVELSQPLVEAVSMKAYFLRSLLAVALLFFAATAQAAPPTVTSVTPRGAERGQSVEIVVAGMNLTPHARLVVPFKATQSLLPDAKPNPAQIRLQLTPDADVPIGVYTLRLLTEDGVSAPFFFSIDVFPTVKEVEDNNTFEKAQKVPFPCVVDGQCAGGDVDHFRFAATKGQRVVVETLAARLGSAVLPQLRITDDRQHLLAADDAQALEGDARVIFTAPADGDYVVELSDTRYRGGNPPHYRLRIGEYDVIEEIFPLGGRRGTTVAFTLRGGTLPSERSLHSALQDQSLPTSMLLPLDDALKRGTLSPRVVIGDLPERIWSKPANREPRSLDVQPPLTINSRLEKPGDHDRFQFAVTPGQRWRFTVQAEALGSRLDGVLRLSDQSGKQLALVDDVDVPPLAPGQAATKTADPSLDYLVPDGVSLLVAEVRDQRHRGGVNYGYRLTIEPATPDFVVIQPFSEINVPRGSSTLLTVPVVRRGYAGPIELTIPNLPLGLTVQGGHIPTNMAIGLLTLTAAADMAALTEPLSLMIEGKAKDGTTAIRRTAEQRFIVSRDPNGASAALLWRQFAVGLTNTEPFTITGPPNLELVKGYPAAVTAKLARAKDQTALAIQVVGVGPVSIPSPGQPAPPGPLVIQPSQPGTGENAPFTVTVPANGPEGALDLAIQGKAKVGAVERTVTSAAVLVMIRRPFEAQLSDNALTLMPGQTVSLKGKIIRQAVFKEAVQLALAGLPAGVTLAAPPKPLTGEQAEFQIDLKVDAKFAATTPVTLTLTCSTTINGMAYTHPPLTVTAKK
jgi:hypothetical protein